MCRRRRLPKGSFPLPEGGYGIDRDGVQIVAGTGDVRVDPEWQSHPNMRRLARALLFVAAQLLAAANASTKRRKP